MYQKRILSCSGIREVYAFPTPRSVLPMCRANSELNYIRIMMTHGLQYNMLTLGVPISEMMMLLLVLHIAVDS